jgi:hypothetical protein
MKSSRRSEGIGHASHGNRGRRARQNYWTRQREQSEGGGAKRCGSSHSSGIRIDVVLELRVVLALILAGQNFPIS